MAHVASGAEEAMDKQVWLGSLCTSVKRGIPNKSQGPGKVSVEEIYGNGNGRSAKEGSTCCCHLDMSLCGQGAVVGAYEVAAISSASCTLDGIGSRQVARWLRTGAMRAVSADETLLVICRSANWEGHRGDRMPMHKVALVEGEESMTPRLFTVSDSFFSCAIRRDNKTGEWPIDPHYLLAFLVSDEGQRELACMDQPYHGGPGHYKVQLGADDVRTALVQVPGMARQREIGDSYAAWAREVEDLLWRERQLREQAIGYASKAVAAGRSGADEAPDVVVPGAGEVMRMAASSPSLGHGGAVSAGKRMSRETRDASRVTRGNMVS